MQSRPKACLRKACSLARRFGSALKRVWATAMERLGTACAALENYSPAPREGARSFPHRGLPPASPQPAGLTVEDSCFVFVVELLAVENSCLGGRIELAPLPSSAIEIRDTYATSPARDPPVHEKTQVQGAVVPGVSPRHACRQPAPCWPSVRKNTRRTTHAAAEALSLWH